MAIVEDLESQCVNAFRWNDHTRAVALLPQLSNPKRARAMSVNVQFPDNGRSSDVLLRILRYIFFCIIPPPLRPSPDREQAHRFTNANLLDLAAQNGWLDVMKDLITIYDFNPQLPEIYNRRNLSCLHFAIFSRSVEVVKYLTDECGCDPMAVDIERMTPLHYAVALNTVDILQHLCDKCNCNSTDVHGMTPLHMAATRSNDSVIEYLLSTGKCDLSIKNNEKKTARQVTRSTHNADLFIKFGEIKTSHPVDSYVNVLLLGNPGAGKSTLGRAITDTTTGSSVFYFFKTVKGVEECTAGIIPTKLQHKELGNITLHDFAGHSEYYSSHTAVIENLLQGSAAVFIIVVNVMEKEALKHFRQWLTVVRNESQKASGQCRIIIVASHVDEKGDGAANKKKKKKKEMQQICSEMCGNKEVAFISLDCRRLGGFDFTSFLNSLSSACQSIRSGKNLSLYCHMMYGLLEEGRQNVFTLPEVMNLCFRTRNFVVPKNQEEVLEILSSLHSTGLICLLRNENNEVWVVVNKQILLAEMNGILFAPKSFQQHCAGMSANTGILTLSDLSEHFCDYDPKMLICFLENMALCHEIDQCNLKATNLHKAIDQPTDKEKTKRYYFFPALLDINRPLEIDRQVYQFGWCLQCTNEHHFFPPRYFHVLSLQLAYKLASPQPSDTLNRQCTFWRNDLHWFNGHGIGTLVEMVNDNQCVLVLMSSEEGYGRNMVPARRDVIREITTVYKESCPSLEVEEFLIDPHELTYPIDDPMRRTVYSVKAIAQCIVEGKPFVTSTNNRINQIEIKKILTEERVRECTTLSLLGERDIKEILPNFLNIKSSRSTCTTADCLGISDLDDIIDKLESNQFACSNWCELGLQLGLYHRTLTDIGYMCRENPKKCLQECLAAWLKREDKVEEKGIPSWSVLTSKLKIIGERRVAAGIIKNL